VLVCNAGHVKNVPGRKTDLADAEWLAHSTKSGRETLRLIAKLGALGHRVPLEAAA
jgi:hypothetical protein